MLPHIDDEMIFFGVPVYGALLLAMVWCAISRAETKSKYNLYLQHLDGNTIPSMLCWQILAKRGTDSELEADANLKALVPKSKQSSIVMYKICIHTNVEA